MMKDDRSVGLAEKQLTWWVCPYCGMERYSNQVCPCQIHPRRMFDIDATHIRSIVVLAKPWRVELTMRYGPDVVVVLTSRGAAEELKAALIEASKL